jgi:hypothetical protein
MTNRVVGTCGTLDKGGTVKKTAIALAVPLLALCVLVVVFYANGTVKSQTSSTPSTTTPSTTTPSATTPVATTVIRNRPVSRWVTANMTFLTTLVDDTKSALSYLSNENLAYAEVACPQLRCDIATMQGRPPPADSLASSRALQAAPSGYRCPPIPDALAAADLNAGMAQLESAISHLITGENRFNGDLIRLAEAEMQSASATFDKVITDLENAQ